MQGGVLRHSLPGTPDAERLFNWGWKGQPVKTGKNDFRLTEND